MYAYLCTCANAGVSFLFWGEKKKAHVPTALDYSKAAAAAAAGRISDHTWSNSLAEFAQHAPAPPKDLFHGIV